ncbi:MAG: thioesterase [Lachnospiraceae bacterium]|nr:thioesterase [Lachnospiraceae bacterium]
MESGELMILFCFTYAGGTLNFFDQLDDCLPQIKFVKLEYSGHGMRHKEPFYNDFNELAEDMYRNIRSYLHGCNSYALMGYSMGSITVIEVLKLIMKRNEILLPRHIFLAAHEPHSKTELVSFDENELDEYVKERTIKFGGIPEKLVNNKIFWRVYLPIYRADYLIIGKYRFEELSLETKIPATIFYSETDTPLKDMMQWQQYFTDNCCFYEFEGNHFFIQEHYRKMAEIILERLNNSYGI